MILIGDSLLKSTKAYFALKMMYLRLKFRVQEDTRVFQCVPMHKQNLKRNILTSLSCTKYNKIFVSYSNV